MIQYIVDLLQSLGILILAICVLTISRKRFEKVKL